MVLYEYSGTDHAPSSCVHSAVHLELADMKCWTKAVKALILKDTCILLQMSGFAVHTQALVFALSLLISASVNFNDAYQDVYF